jgi:prolyl oligopeptidase
MPRLSRLMAQVSQTAPPKTRRDDVTEVIHGVTIADPYRWLEDQTSPETRAWIDAENRYTRSLLDPIPGRDAIRKRLTELEKVDTLGLPRERGGRYFFFRRRPDQDLFVIYVRQGLEGEDQVLLDPHLMSPDHSTTVLLESISQDGKLIAYGVRRGGKDEVSIHLMNVDDRKDLADVLPEARYESVSLTPDKTALYYCRQTAEGPRLFFHSLGSDPASDREIFGKGYGPEKIMLSSLSEDGRYLLVQVLYGAAADKTEIYVQDLAHHAPLVPVVKDINARFLGYIGGSHLFLQTNWKAPKGRVLSVDLGNPAPERWVEAVPETDSAIENVEVAGGKIFVDYLRDASSRLKVFSAEGKFLRDVEFPSAGTLAGISGRWSSDEVFYGFTSFHIPFTVYRYDSSEGRASVWASQKVPFDSSRFEVQQVWYESKDKTKVPMFLVYAKGLKRDGSNPTLLTGYGGFDASETPAFSSVVAFWVERGGVLALPNLRGGGEFGEAWHHAGMLEKKQNVFDDFIAAAEWLIQNNYTRPSRLAIAGVSNGGLLVGAALTQRPDLFGAVVCRYPLLDMIRYHKFLVAPFWIPEYGSSDNPEQFKYLLAYSPYQNVKPGTKYPAVLFVSGDSDTRVAPLHARKMAALLQAETGSDRPVLLLYDTESGHSGGRPLSKTIDEQTDEQSFILWQLGALPKQK